MAEAMTKVDANARMASYDVDGTHVELTTDFIKQNLVRGRAELVNDQELILFLQTCRARKLNPMVQGEVYLIKYDTSQPAQMVVGKDAYLRRAYDNPNYLDSEDGIIIRRGDEIVSKPGCCLYPGETLVGGWCKVHYVRNGKEREAYVEVSLAEYNKGQANWKTKPSTMINKVAISQCLRKAFPKDYEGTYSEDEMIASGAVEADFKEMPTAAELENGDSNGSDLISRDQAKNLINTAIKAVGREQAGTIIKAAMAKFGYESTHDITVGNLAAVEQAAMAEIQKHLAKQDETVIDAEIIEQ